MKRAILDYINDIVDSMAKTKEFVRDMPYEKFLQEVKTQFAAVRAIEIIGEATKNIPASVRKKYPQIPWREIVGMRDKVVHEYFGLNLMVIRKTVKEDIPAVKPSFEKLREDYVHEYEE
ncbi:MAG: DUF86 domain-containing protein [Spirochaetes bacterium]|nr:MAG: DUF86 domain-containing protein [Spirochaetota bacterium]